MASFGVGLRGCGGYHQAVDAGRLGYRMARIRVFYGWWVVSASAGIIFLTGGTFY
jgi:uncharacterized membrane protein